MDKRLKNKKNLERIGVLLSVLGYLAILVLGLFAVQVTRQLSGSAVAYANSPTYSGVLEDLSKDSSFTPENYPDRAEDYSLQVVQLAESNEKQLFVYVYQPSHAEKDLTATGIRFSTGINANAHWKDYSLQLVSTAGTLDKYLVKDFAVLPDALRYYDVVLLHRVWDSAIDKPITGGTVDEVACTVAALFTASTVGGSVSYHRTESKVIEITDKAVGFCRYSNGFHLYVSSCDAHFIAFSTDYSMDKLLEADVSWQVQPVTTVINPYGKDYVERGELEDKSATLKYTDAVEHTGDGWFSKTYNWERIESASTFLKKEDLTDATRAAMANKQWVLRFYETSYTLNSFTNTKVHTDVTKVTILRLKFETDGKTYNLGVVDNKQSGDELPDNNDTNDWDFWGWLLRQLKKLAALLPWWTWLMIAVVAFGFVLSILSFVFPPVFGGVKFVFKAVLWLTKAIGYIIASPVLLVVWMVKKAKGEA